MTNVRKGTALITGASSGIGAAYADRLARRGYDVILVARNRLRLHELAARLESGTDALVGVLAADLTDEADLRRVERAFGLDSSINLLVNSAGMGLVAPTLDSNIDTMQQMISLNVTALTRLNYAAATEFVDRGHGTIINIASGVALVPEILNGVYGASKAFVLGLSQALRQELEGTGVRVQVVMPGAVATEFWDHAGRPVEQLPGEIVMSVDDVVDAALAGLDLGEFATLPALPSIEEWNAFDAARVAFRPKISSAKPARRYGGGQTAAG
jgi:short-subunit dehydrogenase